MTCVICHKPIEEGQGWCDTRDRTGRVHIRCADTQALAAHKRRKRVALDHLGITGGVSLLLVVALAPSMMKAVCLSFLWICYLATHGSTWLQALMWWWRGRRRVV